MRSCLRHKVLASLLLVLLSAAANAATLSASARHKWDQYIAEVESRLSRQHANRQTYIATLAGAMPQTESDLLAGKVQITAVNGGTKSAADAVIHHWRAAAYVPGATASDMLAVLRDYAGLASHYAPQVVSSRVLARNNRTATIAMRMRQDKVITVTLDGEFQIESGLTAPDRGCESSRSLHIWEVEDAGTPHEHHDPDGGGDGYLWRLNSYWSFENWRDGVVIECEAVSLTRDVPMFLGWLITPFISDVPKDSLNFTISATRSALLQLAENEMPK